MCMSEQCIDPANNLNFREAPEMLVSAESARQLPEQLWHRLNPNARLHKIREMLVQTGMIDWSSSLAAQPLCSTMGRPVIMPNEPKAIYLVSCWPGSWVNTGNDGMTMKARPEIRIWRFPPGYEADTDCRFGIIKPSLDHAPPNYISATGYPIDPSSKEAQGMTRIATAVAGKQPAVEVIRHCDATP